MLSRGAVKSLPEFFWSIVLKLPEFHLFCDKSARIFLIFPSICPNFHGFLKCGQGGGICPSCSLSRTPMVVLTVNYRTFMYMYYAVLICSYDYKLPEVMKFGCLQQKEEF